MKRSVYILFLCIAALAATGCSTTKRIPEGEYLYTGVRKITIEADSSKKVPSSVESAVKDPLSVKPNNPLYSPYIRTPIPTGLWAWNYLYTERKTGLKAWLFRRLAKEPVLVSKVQPQLRTSLVEDILDNHGYFGSSASYEIIDQNNPKKKRISYRVHVAEPWFLRDVEYPSVQGPVTKRIGELQATSNIREGAQYNIDTMTRERVRITNICLLYTTLSP